MNKKIAYSVIIPHFNDTDRLQRLLNSIPALRDDIEILVIDDCSARNTNFFHVQSKWTSVRWMSTSKNSGAGAARNLGLMHALGEYIIFADSDDEFCPFAFDVFDYGISGQDVVYFLADGVQ